jgi:hypothetical protein
LRARGIGVTPSLMLGDGDWKSGAA